MVGCHFPTYWERTTNIACSESILNLTFDRCDLLLQDRPIYDKHLHLDFFRASDHGKHDLARNDHGSLWTPFLCISFSSYGPDNILCFLEVSHICGHEVFPSWSRSLKLREGSMYIGWPLGWLHFPSRDARMCKRRRLHSSTISMLCTRLEQFKQLYVAHVLDHFLCHRTERVVGFVLL